MSARSLGLGVIGLGDVAQRYGETLALHPRLELRGVHDRNPPRVADFVARHGGAGYDSIDALLADPEVELVLNLTRQHAHFELTARCLEAGKHVYSEKPLAMTHAQARELVALAERNGVRLACAPITYLGEAQQAAAAIVRAGTIGEVRMVYAEVNWGRIERWHPRPADYYEVGVTFDVAVYPLTILTALFGPARRVEALGRRLLPERTALDGSTFPAVAPDWTVALVQLACGTLVRLTTSFYTEHKSRQHGLELHGDLGAVALSSWHRFDADVELALGGAPYEPVAPERPPFAGTDYTRGPAELASAILEGRPHFGSGEHAAHVVEIVEAVATAVETGAAVELASDFPAWDGEWAS